jgi:dihydrodipicolinate synthase/N-acetylneuraminate lyase
MGRKRASCFLIAGEFYKFSDDGRQKCLEVVIDEANRKVHVWMGVNHIGTEQAVSLGKRAKDAGADGVIAMPAFVGTKNRYSTEGASCDDSMES